MSYDTAKINKVIGESVFPGDYRIPGMLWAGEVRAQIPSGRILSTNLTDIQKLPGIKRVITHKEVPGLNLISNHPHAAPVFAEEKVRFHGESIALVVAESDLLLKKALDAVIIKYEELPGVFDPLEALQEGAPRIHEDGNLLGEIAYEKGNVDEAFASAPIVFEHTYYTPSVDHAYLEPEAVIAVPQSDDTILLLSNSQYPVHLRKCVAEVLNFAQEKVIFQSLDVGGAFGGKDEISIEICARAALAALITGEPVKLKHSREDSMIASTKRHAAVINFKTAASADGKLIAAQVDFVLNKGAFSGTGGNYPPALQRAALHAIGPYEVPNVRVHARAAHTNIVNSGQMRGPGVPQLMFAAESQMDILAEKVGLDPVSIRIANAVRDGSLTGWGQTLKNCGGYLKCLAEAKKTYEKARREFPASGIGVAGYWFGISASSSPDYARARIYLDKTGRLRLACGISDLGQGTHIALKKILAKELGWPQEKIYMEQPDTRYDPDSKTTTSSRSLTMAGMATIDAAQKAKEKIKAYSENVVGNNDFELLAEGEYYTPDLTFDPETGQGEAYNSFAFGVQIAVLDANALTGQITMKRIHSINDVGKAIMPQLVEGQIEGAVSLGLGYALSEEVYYRNGVIQNPSFDTYILPTAVDVPEIVTTLVEDTNVNGPWGAKGIGEPPAVGVAPAVANALYDAAGVRIFRLPMTSQAVYEKLNNK